MTPQSQLISQSPTIAVVDDDPAVRNSLKFSLELEGFTVRAYRSAAELLNAGELGDCRCYVIDQRMPDMNGIDLIGKAARTPDRNAGHPRHQPAQRNIERAGRQGAGSDRGKAFPQ